MASRTPVRSRTVRQGGTVNTLLSMPIGSGNTFGKGPKATKRSKFPRIRGLK